MQQKEGIKMFHHAIFFGYAMTQHKKKEEVDPLPVADEVEEEELDSHAKMFFDHYKNFFKD
jgi:hypothetical protein